MVQEPLDRHICTVLWEVGGEIRRATHKFPKWPTDPFHAKGVVDEESGELEKAILQHIYEPEKGVTKEDIREEAIQMAAMAIRFCLSLDEYEYVNRGKHEQ